MITQERLKELLHYDQETGAFTWKVRTTNSVHVGDAAGGVTQHGYVTIFVDKNAYYAHRLAWLYVNGGMPTSEIDHINHNGLDNRISNIRCVTHRDNARNQSIMKSNTSGVVGISFDKSRAKWKAYITVDSKRIDLGRHKDISAAIMTRYLASRANDFHENHGK